MALDIHTTMVFGVCHCGFGRCYVRDLHFWLSDTEGGVPYLVIVVAVNEKGSGLENPLLHFFGERSKYFL